MPSAKPTEKKSSLKLEEFSDRELLWGFEEAMDEDGTCTSKELAQNLGLPNLEHAHRNISIRLGWQRRYGIVDRNDDGRWFITDTGKGLLHGHLRTPEKRMLDDLDPMKLLTVMEHVGRTMRLAPNEAATMATRDWRYHVAARKRSR